MGCCGCDYKTWTKICISFTNLFCLAQIAAEAYIFYVSNNAPKTNLNLVYLYTYLHDNTKVFALNIVSLILNLLWIIASINVLAHLPQSEIKSSLFTSYILWHITAIASFIVDVISTIIYGLDYKAVNTPDKLYMLAISTRFIIGFILNICAIIGMIVITIVCRKNLGKQSKKRIVPLKPPKPVLKKPNKETYLEENNVDRVRDWYNHYENQNDYQPNPTIPSYIPRLNEVPHDNETTRNTDSHNNGHTDNGHNHALPGSHTNVLVNGVPSGTLRRQLPWTYMQNPNELPQRQPRKQPVLVPTPYVPAPDYYQKGPTPNSRRDFKEPGWSQHL